MVVQALCSTPMKLKGKTQLPQEPLDPLPEPLPDVVGEDVEGPVDDLVDPGGEQVFAPVSWESIQLLKWPT